MNAVSSYAPMDRALEVTRNQMAALESWRKGFSSITYFNSPDPFLTAPGVRFVTSGDPPKIIELVKYAASLPDWTAIINADIIVLPKLTKLVPMLSNSKLACAISRRFEFDPELGPKVGEIVDYGLDIFVAEPVIWQAAAHAIPPQFAIGHQLWDTWMLSFFLHQSRGRCADFTGAKAIWHPRHGNRGDFSMAPPENDFYLRAVTWPTRNLWF